MIKRCQSPACKLCKFHTIRCPEFFKDFEFNNGMIPYVKKDATGKHTLTLEQL